jgi:hypothetical protein
MEVFINMGIGRKDFLELTSEYLTNTLHFGTKTVEVLLAIKKAKMPAKPFLIEKQRSLTTVTNISSTIENSCTKVNDLF